jgi:hypothetical protein
MPVKGMISSLLKFSWLKNQDFRVAHLGGRRKTNHRHPFLLSLNKRYLKKRPLVWDVIFQEAMTWSLRIQDCVLGVAIGESTL